LFNCLFVLVDGIYPHTHDLSKASNNHWQMPRSVTLLGRRHQGKTSNALLGTFKVAFRWWQGLFLDICWRKLATLSQRVWSCTIFVCLIESWAAMFMLGTILQQSDNWWGWEDRTRKWWWDWRCTAWRKASTNRACKCWQCKCCPECFGTTKSFARVKDSQEHTRLYRALLALKGWGKCTPNIA
jgi:hypothetical protein